MSGIVSRTQQICRFAAGLSLSQVPPHIVQKLKLHIADSIGCGIAGSSTQLGRDVTSFASIENSQGRVPVLGAGVTLGPASAAFANSGCMNALDCDDGVEVDGKGMGHPGASIVAAAVSGIFQQPEVSGKRFLEVVLAAYEVNNRLIHAIQPSMERFRLVYGVCQHQSVSSAVAYALLLGVDGDELANVVGLAGTLSNVPSLRKYNFDARPIVSLKDFNAPAAETGVRATQMHSLGFRGAVDVLDGEAGLWRMLGSDTFSPDLLTAGLGSEWTIERGTFKAYPACRWMHTVMEAFETTMSEANLVADEIDEVVIHGSSILQNDFMTYRPQGMVDAQFSLPYALAALASRIKPFADWYSSGSLQYPVLQSFADKVTAVVDPEVDRLMSDFRRPAGKVTIVVRGQRIESSLLTYALGSPERPMTFDDIQAKFLSNTAPVVGETAAIAMWARLMHMDRETRACNALTAVDPR